MQALPPLQSGLGQVHGAGHCETPHMPRTKPEVLEEISHGVPRLPPLPVPSDDTHHREEGAEQEGGCHAPSI